MDHYQYPGETPNELQHIKLTVIDQKQCLNTNFRVNSNNICTLNKKGEGACHVSAHYKSSLIKNLILKKYFQL